MKKFLFLVLLLAGCDSPNDIEFSAEQLVKYNCKPTGEFIIDRINTSTRGIEMRDIKYYLYVCAENKNHMSKVLIEK